MVDVCTIHRGQWGAWHVISDGVRLLQHWHDVCVGGDGPMGPHCYRMPRHGCQVYGHPDGGMMYVFRRWCASGVSCGGVILVWWW